MWSRTAALSRSIPGLASATRRGWRASTPSRSTRIRATPTASPTTSATQPWWWITSTRSSSPAPWSTTSGAERLTTRQWARLEAAFDTGDLNDETYLAWAVKEALRDVYRAGSLPAARTQLDAFYAWATESGVPECHRLARTVRRWQDQILAYFTTGCVTNARSEAAIIWSPLSAVFDVADEAA